MNAGQLLFWIGAGLLVLGLSVTSYMLLAMEGAEISDQGLRGYKRQRARRSSGFRALEPVLRLFTSWIAWMPLGSTRESIDLELQKSGYHLGLSADELLALSVASGALLGYLGSLVHSNPIIIVAAFFLASLLPFAMVSSAANQRSVMIARQLPSVIELIALCVSAGMDLPGALHEVIGDDPEEDDPLREELRQLLREIGLGHSRRDALESLAKRVQGEGVQDFCASLIQSEEKGNPLKEVLEAQAKILHMRRSFRAEVMASQAAVKLVIPLTLLMLCVMLLVGGPLFLKLNEAGL